MPSQFYTCQLDEGCQWHVWCAGSHSAYNGTVRITHIGWRAGRQAGGWPTGWLVGWLVCWLTGLLAKLVLLAGGLAGLVWLAGCVGLVEHFVSAFGGPFRVTLALSGSRRAPWKGHLSTEVLTSIHVF